MIPAYRKKSNLGIGTFVVGLALVTVTSKSLPTLAGVLALVTYVSLFYGCVMYAKGKGYSGWLGSLGIFFILGFIVLAVLPDREKQADKTPFAHP